MSEADDWKHEALRLFRREKDWTLEDLRERLADQGYEASRSSLHRWESPPKEGADRSHVPPLEARRALAAVFRRPLRAFTRIPKLRAM